MSEGYTRNNQSVSFIVCGNYFLWELLGPILICQVWRLSLLMSTCISLGTGTPNQHLKARPGVKKRPRTRTGDRFGKMSGPDVDLVRRICMDAGKNCELVHLQSTAVSDSDSNGINVPGKVLLDGTVDAAVSYLTSMNRMEFWDFTKPYAMMGTPKSLVILKGSGVNINDLTGKTIGFARGSVGDRTCFEMLNPQGDYDGTASAGVGGALQDLRDGKIDGAFVTNRGNTNVQAADLEIVTQPIDCGLRAIAVKKGSCLPSWFNPALKNFMRTDDYSSAYCTDIRDRLRDIGRPSLTTEEVCIFNH